MDLEIFEDKEVKEQYEKVKDKISKEEFLEKMKEFEKDYEDISFYGAGDYARMAATPYLKEENEVLSQNDENQMNKINKLVVGGQNITLTAKVMGISNIKKFTSRKGNEGKLCNMNIADDTGSIKVTLWTDNIKLLNNVKEGDVIQLTNAEAKDGYRGIELQLQPRSQIKVLDSNDYPEFPEYVEKITPINEIEPDTEVNIIARIKRLQNIRNYNSKGKKGKVTSIELQDATGKINYSLWNRDVELINDLGLEEGDSIKILRAQSTERNDEISLSHRESKIIKGDYDVPEFQETILKIGDAHEEKDVTIVGLVTKIQDKTIFKKRDGTDGQVKSIEISDDTGKIRLTLWNDNADIEFNKGDIVKISGGNIEFDDYSESGYRLNTNWNSQITIDPKCDQKTLDTLNEIKSAMRPLTIEEIQEIDEDGEEIDVIGRIMSLGDIREFTRDDSSDGSVRSIQIADNTGMVRVSLWDSKAKEEMKIGTPVLLENVRTRLSMEVELNVGSQSRIITLNENETGNLLSFDELEETNYELVKIADLDEDETRIRVVGRILDIDEVREFQRVTGETGKLRNFDLADETGLIRATLWDSKIDLGEFKVGSPIKIQNPGTTYRNDRVELSIGGNSILVTPSEEELKSLPSEEELRDQIYQLKNIENLDSGDINVRIKGQLTDIRSDNIVLMRCPTCNNRLNGTEETSICDNCGSEITEPNYLLILPAKIQDETGEIAVTFFDKLVEELLEMPKEEILEIVLDSDELGGLEGKIEDLTNLTIDLIADVGMDEYSETDRLTPRKILSKEL